MKRREFLRSAGIVSAGFAFPKMGRTFGGEDLANQWRTFEVTTGVELLAASGPSKIWLPTGLTAQTPFQKTLNNEISVEGGRAKRVDQKEDGLGIMAAESRAGATPILRVTSRIATRDYAV